MFSFYLALPIFIRIYDFPYVLHFSSKVSQAVCERLEKRVDSVQKEFMQA